MELWVLDIFESQPPPAFPFNRLSRKSSSEKNQNIFKLSITIQTEDKNPFG
jgi:hypothetical protein